MYYEWTELDDLYMVAGNPAIFPRSGWATPDDFAQQIVGANPAIIVWSRVPAGTLVYLPFA